MKGKEEGSNQSKKRSGSFTNKLGTQNKLSAYCLIPSYLKKPLSIDKNLLLQYLSNNMCENERYFDDNKFWKLQTNYYFENEQGQLEIKCPKCFVKDKDKNYLKIKNILEYRNKYNKLNQKVQRNRSRVMGKLKEFLNRQNFTKRELI